MIIGEITVVSIQMKLQQKYCFYNQYNFQQMHYIYICSYHVTDGLTQRPHDIQSGHGVEGNVYSVRCAWPHYAISHLKISYIIHLLLKQ